MKVTITHISNVIDFLNKGFDTVDIDKSILKEIQLLINNLELKKLVDWELEFVASYVKADEIRIFNKIPIDKEEKLKSVIIHVPIPLQDKVEWGVLPNQHISRTGNKPLKNVEYLNIDCKDYDNRKDYVRECINKGIHRSLELGFSIDGTKVKTK
ncbi:Imm9 family immunity protein [Muricauda sp. SCSIO 64092]|uniref:Imm9 family immunity protein n=1 Tax=Allomuricauda sp. SCSIO 64092 TaxID=2908842 RepID=UPI001FF2BA4E|nr:Imm9 family immunity protein [Muricauda sp. SCSIO 64092]UOY06608.1 Imm9 family immunity protein [Muricauda sp. SCSIO 64092]